MFEQKIEIPSKRNLNIVSHQILMPDNIPGRQKVVDINFTTKPDLINHNNEDYYLIYEAKTLKELDEIVVSSDLILYRNDWFTAKQRIQPIESKPDLDPFLRAEHGIESESKQIKNLANKLLAENREQTVRNIFQFVTDTLTYDNSLSQARSALQALRTGKGDCTEYTELMIALCRANSIPARYVNGFVTRGGSVTNPRHNWVEVYFNEHGWVAFDPTFADGQGARTTFDKMENIYIVISFTRNSSSGWIGEYYSFTLKYGYRSINYLDKFINEINRLLYNNELEKFNFKVDSLLDEGLTDHRLYLHRAMVNLSENKMDEALSDLQGALKYSYFENEKSSIFIRFAAYYAVNGKQESAIKSLQKAFKNNYRASRNDFRFLTENDFFDSVKENPYYTQLISELRLTFSTSISAISEYNSILMNWTELVNLDCYYEPGPIIFPGHRISHKQVINGKVKLLRAFSHNFINEYLFDSKGFLTTQYIHWDFSEGINCIWYKYDENERLIEKHSGGINIQKDTVMYHVYKYNYSQDCLTSVTVRDYKLNRLDTVLILEIHPNYIYLESFEYKAISTINAKKNKLFFDDEGRREKLITYMNNDSISLEWVYDDTKKSITHYVDGHQKSYEELNDKNQLIYRKSKTRSLRKVYDKSGRLIKYIYEGYGSPFIYKLKYNKNNLPKAIYYKQKNGKFREMERYEYEYY